MRHLRELSPGTLIILAVFLAVVVAFNLFMWQNYRRIERQVDRFGDDNHFDGRAEAGSGHRGDDLRGRGDDEGNLRLALIVTGSAEKKELMRRGAEQAAARRGVGVKFYHADPAGQMSPGDYLELAGMAGYDGVMLEGASEDLSPAIDRLGERLPLITVNSDFPDSRRLSYVGLDHHQAGYQIGRYLLRRIEDHPASSAGGGSEDPGERGSVLLLSSQAGAGRSVSTSEQLKIFGFQEALAASEERPDIVHREVSPDLLEVTGTVSRLRQEEDITAIFTPGEEITLTLAEASEFSEADRDIFMIGYGSRAGLGDELKRPGFDALVYRDSEQIGRQAVEEMVTILSEGSVNLHSQVDMEIISSREGTGSGAETISISDETTGSSGEVAEDEAVPEE